MEKKDVVCYSDSINSIVVSVSYIFSNILTRHVIRESMINSGNDVHYSTSLITDKHSYLTKSRPTLFLLLVV